MFKKKAKRILLGFVLVLTSVFCFACKDKQKTVALETIKFNDEVIELLVGESYTPDVTILPTDASKRSYKLVSEDISVLSVNGGTITALKPALGVQLKVVSDENSLINDMISVNIYAQPVNLSAPKNFVFNGNKFSFNEVKGADSYLLKVGNKEINIGNNTTYTFSNLVGKVDNLYNTNLEVSVKAVGDERIYISSQYSASLKLIKLTEIEQAYIEDEKLYIKSLPYVDSYLVKVLKGGEEVLSVEVDDEQNGYYVLDVASLSDSINGAQYDVQINANCNGLIVDQSKVYDGNPTTLAYKVLQQVKNVVMNNYVITWNKVDGADNYTVQICNETGTYREYKDITTNRFAIDIIESAGEYWCKVIANSNAEQNVLSGKIYSSNVYFEVLHVPTLTFNNGVISWADTNAEGYLLYIENASGDPIVDEVLVSGTSYRIEDYAAGDYKIQVASCGNGLSTLRSSYTNLTNFAILNKVSELSVKNKTVSWKDNDANSLHNYKLIVKLGNVEKFSVDINNTNYAFEDGIYTYTLPNNIGAGEYTVEVVNIGFNNIFDSNKGVANGQTSIAKINYSVLAQVSGLGMNNYVASWNQVNKATSYTVNLYKSLDNSKIKEYRNIETLSQDMSADIKVGENYSGGYYYNVVANIDNTVNIDSENLVSSNCIFNVLKPAVITCANESISWTSDNADGNTSSYLIEVSNAFATLPSMTFDKSKTSYTIPEIEQKYMTILQAMGVNAIPAGSYNLAVSVVGNNSTHLQSPLTSTEITLLDKVSQVAVDSVNSKILKWKDLDNNSLKNYTITVHVDQNETQTIELTASDLGTAFNYDEGTQYYSLDLSSYDFGVGNHNISITSVGNNAEIFSSKQATTSVTQLADATITGISNKVFDITTDAKTTSYEIKVFTLTDTEFTAPINIVNDKTINVDNLNAGNYIARIYAYGNDVNIFDAKNASVTYSFEKLAVPTISLAGTTIQISNVTNASNYLLIQNGQNQNYVQSYDVSSLTAGEYTYTCQAVGNNGNVLDSKISSQNIKVKKLATPSLSFDKNSKVFTISCHDSGVVENYSFELWVGDEQKLITTIEGVTEIDCSTYLETASTYTAKVSANRETELEGFDLVLNSNIYESNPIIKLSGEASVSVNNKQLVITPSVSLGYGEYFVNVTISKGSDSVTINDFNYNGTSFVKNLYDSKFDILEFQLDGGGKLFEQAGDYSISVVIDKQDSNTICSNSTNLNAVTVVNEVNSVTYTNNQITFNTVGNVTTYYIIITLNETTKYIDITDKYSVNDSDSSENIIEINTLRNLLELNGISYLTDTFYSVGFIGIPDNNAIYIPNKCDARCEFKFLEQPIVVITEQGLTAEENWDEILTIENNVDDNIRYNITFIQDAISKEIVLDTTNSSYKLSQLTDFVAGAITITITANPINDKTTTYASSITVTQTINKIANAEINVSAGKLTWNTVANARQYKLSYLNDQNELVYKVLKQGDENFTDNGETCTYDCVDMPVGNNTYYVQADSKLDINGTKYINSAQGNPVTNVYKLNPAIISVKSGWIEVKINKQDYSSISSITALLDDRTAKVWVESGYKDLNLKSYIDSYIEAYTQNNNIDYTGDVAVIVDSDDTYYICTINPTALLNYTTNLNATSLSAENLYIKLNTTSTNKLNANSTNKDLCGLLAPTGVRITTSTETTGIKEVIEKITWENPIANSTYVNKYEVAINYLCYLEGIDGSLIIQNSTFYFNTTETSMIMPKYYDADNSGTLTAGDTEFKAGDYTVKVRAITNNNQNILISHYSTTINISVLKSPTHLGVTGGDLSWTGNAETERYFIRVYNMSSGNKELVASTSTASTTFDLTSLSLGNTDMIYGITIQGLHSNSNVLASEESEFVEMIRLPQAKGYYIKDGVLYVRVHKFFNNLKLYVDGNSLQPLFIENNEEQINPAINNFIIEHWEDIRGGIIDTYTDEDYYFDVPFIYDTDNNQNINYDLQNVSTGEHTLDIKLYGTNSLINIANVNIGMLSGTTLTNAKNLNCTNNIVNKLATPTVSVSDSIRGRVELRLPTGVEYNSFEYFKTESAALKGVNLYKITLTTNQAYTFNVAKITDKTLFNNSSNLIEENGLKYFEYNGICYNVLDELNFDLDVNKYYYYTTQGGYEYIDLSLGGSIIIKAKLLGDDTYYVNSNDSVEVTVNRYDPLALQSIGGGLRWEHKASENDVYIIELTKDNNTYSVVLYNESQGNVSDILGNSRGYIYATYDDSNISNIDGVNYITYSTLGEEIFGVATNNSNSSTFSALVKLYYINETDLSKLLAQGNPTTTITVLGKPNVTAIEGELTWDQIVVGVGSSVHTIKNYKLEIYNTTNQSSYSMNLNPEDYEVKAGVITYKLKQKYDTFNIESNIDYIFKVTALADNNASYINSKQGESAELQMLQAVSNLTMSNGVLSWESEISKAEVIVSFDTDERTITYKEVINGNSFDLHRTSKLDTTETTVWFYALDNQGQPYNYTISVRVLGDNSVLSSFREVKENLQRLPNIDENSIRTESGVLVWDYDSSLNAKFTIKYTLDDNSIKTITDLSNSFEFSGIISENIKFIITAENNDKFKSFNTREFTVSKLDVPTEVKYNEANKNITWKAVKDASGKDIAGYKIKIVDSRGENYYSLDTSDRQQTYETISWNIPAGIDSEFKISIQSVAGNDNIMTVNSEFSDGVTLTRPNAIDKTQFMYNTELLRFEFVAIQGEQINSDKYYIGYKYYANPGLSDYENVKTEIVNHRTIQGVKHYYFEPSAIGVYKEVYVQVVRAEGLASESIYCYNGEDEMFILDFNWFGAGDGSEANKYQITNETQLRNIAICERFLSAKFVITKPIELESVNPITNENQVFKGSLTGSSANYISADGQNLWQANLTGSGNYRFVGLFNKTKNASFTDIYLSGFNISGYLDKNTTYIGCLAAYAENSTFNEIHLQTAFIDIVKNNINSVTNNSISVYIGGIVGYASNCIVNKAVVQTSVSEQSGIAHDISLNVVGNANTAIYVGGILGYAESGTLNNNKVNFVANYTLTSTDNQNNPTVYTGICVGGYNNSKPSISGTQQGSKCDVTINNNKQTITANIGKQ